MHLYQTGVITFYVVGVWMVCVCVCAAELRWVHMLYKPPYSRSVCCLSIRGCQLLLETRNTWQSEHVILRQSFRSSEEVFGGKESEAECNNLTYLWLRVIMGQSSSVAHLAVPSWVLLSFFQLCFCPVLFHKEVIYHPEHEGLKETQKKLLWMVFPHEELTEVIFTWFYISLIIIIITIILHINTRTRTHTHRNRNQWLLSCKVYKEKHRRLTLTKNGTMSMTMASSRSGFSMGLRRASCDTQKHIGYAHKHTQQHRQHT